MRRLDWIDLMGYSQMLLQAIGFYSILLWLGVPWWVSSGGAAASVYVFDRVLLRLMEVDHGPPK